MRFINIYYGSDDTADHTVPCFLHQLPSIILSFRLYPWKNIFASIRSRGPIRIIILYRMYFNLLLSGGITLNLHRRPLFTPLANYFRIDWLRCSEGAQSK